MQSRQLFEILVAVIALGMTYAILDRIMRSKIKS